MSIDDVLSGRALWTIEHGNALTIAASLPPCSIDAIVTDPPAGIAFMGREWDSDKGGEQEWIAWLTAILSEGFRALKPGGHAIV